MQKYLVGEGLNDVGGQGRSSCMIPTNDLTKELSVKESKKSKHFQYANQVSKRESSPLLVVSGTAS